jgi:hypothetical protein
MVWSQNLLLALTLQHCGIFLNRFKNLNFAKVSPVMFATCATSTKSTKEQASEFPFVVNIFTTYSRLQEEWNWIFNPFSLYFTYLK